MFSSRTIQKPCIRELLELSLFFETFLKLSCNNTPLVARNVRDYLSAGHIQLLPWPAYLPELSPIEHVQNSVYLRLACDTCSTSCTDELWKRIQRMWNTRPIRLSKSIRIHATTYSSAYFSASLLYHILISEILQFLFCFENVIFFLN